MDKGGYLMFLKVIPERFPQWRENRKDMEYIGALGESGGHRHVWIVNFPHITACKFHPTGIVLVKSAELHTQHRRLNLVKT